MCNCIKELEDNFKKVTESNEKFKNVNNISVSCDNVALVFSRNSSKTYSRPYLTFTAEGEYITKSGNVRNRKTSMNAMFTYCPYCGEKYEDKKED